MIIIKMGEFFTKLSHSIDIANLQKKIELRLIAQSEFVRSLRLVRFLEFLKEFYNNRCVIELHTLPGKLSFGQT